MPILASRPRLDNDKWSLLARDYWPEKKTLWNDLWLSFNGWRVMDWLYQDVHHDANQTHVSIHLLKWLARKSHYYNHSQHFTRTKAVCPSHNNFSSTDFTKKMKFVLFSIALLPMASAQCPAAGGTITWSGPCTYETILTETSCELNDIIDFVEELQEACDAAAL